MSAKNDIRKHHSSFTQPFLKRTWFERQGRAGFMLLEVLLSVIVVTVGVVFVVGSFITSVKAFKVSNVYVEMLYLLEDRLWEYEEKGKIEDGNDSGKFDDYKGAEWELDAKELEDEDIPLLLTTAEVSIKKEEQKRYFKVTTYFYKAD